MFSILSRKFLIDFWKIIALLKVLWSSLYFVKHFSNNLIFIKICLYKFYIWHFSLFLSFLLLAFPRIFFFSKCLFLNCLFLEKSVTLLFTHLIFKSSRTIFNLKNVFVFKLCPLRFMKVSKIICFSKFIVSLPSKVGIFWKCFSKTQL